MRRPLATAQPAAQQASNSCNVQACGAAYFSFRAADCSYQPAVGPRRACTIGACRAHEPQQVARAEAAGGGASAATHPVCTPDYRPSQGQATGQGEMSESERIVRQMTRNESGDIPVQDGQGNIIIVRKTYR